MEQKFSQIDAEEQAGFRAGRSTIDHVFCLKQLIEKKMSVNQPLHLLYVDLEKPYDSVPLKNLWKALKYYNISNSIIRAIKTLYENSISKIKIWKQLSSGFYGTKGLQQGCSLSPTLYKIYIQSALENWQKKCARMGVEIQDMTIYSMLFADDQLLSTQDYEDLEYMTRKLIDGYELWGLKLNVRKTTYMAIGDTSRDLQLEDEKGTISHVSENIYLGVRITKDGNHEPEINDRINRGQAAISKLNSILWDCDVTPKTKTHIYHATAKSTITYAAETWCLNAKTIAKLNSTEMDFWQH
jgi:hypothetical protein